MKKNIFIIILIYVAIFTKIEVQAKCENSEIVRLRSLASNINLSFDYYISNNEAYFNITLNNITPDLYFVDTVTGAKYYYENTTDGEITIYGYKGVKGSYKIYSTSGNCNDTVLNNLYYNLPTYNKYYSDPLCQENRNYSLCQKWIKVNYSYEEFKKLIDDYNEKKNEEEKQDSEPIVYEKTVLNEFVNFYVKYYYIILISIIAICVVIMIISRRKNRFDL